jgi:hypothetical protein
MPAYVNTPFGPTPKLVIAGWPEYLIGSYNADVAVGRGVVTADATTSTTAGILYVQLLEGNIPVVGDFVSVQGTNNTSGQFNVSNQVISGVAIDANTGIGTITYTTTVTLQAKIADGGTFRIRQAEVGESVASTDFFSAAVSVPFQDTKARGDRTVTVIVSTPVNSTFLCPFSLQGAMNDIDAEYVSIPTAIYTGSTGTMETAVTAPASAGASVFAEYTLSEFRFYRLWFDLTSGSATVVAKIMA